MIYHRKAYGSDNGYGKMSLYQEQDPRTTFISVFPVSGSGNLLHKRTFHSGTAGVSITNAYSYRKYEHQQPPARCLFRIFVSELCYGRGVT